MKSSRGVTHKLLAAISTAVLIGLYLPILVVVIFSFNKARFGSVWSGFTTEWYVKLLTNEAIESALLNTLQLAITSTLISTCLGTALGISLGRIKPRWPVLSEALLHLPVVVSDIVLAVSLVGFYAAIRSFTGLFELGFAPMVMSHITFQIPFVALVVRARMERLPRTLEDAALDLGASRRQVLRYIITPLLYPAVISGGLLAFTLSMDDFVFSFFTSGPGSTTLPVFIFASVKRGVTPEINAVSSILLFFSIGLTLLGLRLQRE